MADEKLGWDRKAAGVVSDAIPNEMSKMNGWSNWLQYIPYVGQVLSAVWKGGAATDNFAETYENTGDFNKSAQHGMKGVQGQSADPNADSEKNQNFWTDDTTLNIGKVGNFVPSPKGGGSGGNGGGGSFSGGGSSYMDLASLFGKLGRKKSTPIKQEDSVDDISGAQITREPTLEEFLAMNRFSAN